MSWVSKQWRSVKKRAHQVGEALQDVSDVGYNIIGQQSPHQKQEQKNAENDARGTALAEERQAEYEEQAARGAEMVKARRRRGYQSTILAGNTLSYSKSSLGSSGTLLGS